jgi:hypothetical protein
MMLTKGFFMPFVPSPSPHFSDFQPVPALLDTDIDCPKRDDKLHWLNAYPKPNTSPEPLVHLPKSSREPPGTLLALLVPNLLQLA